MQEINKTNLTRLKEKCSQWSQYAGFDKRTEIENLIDINNEIKEAYEAREDATEFHKELADIVIIGLRIVNIRDIDPAYIWTPFLRFPSVMYLFSRMVGAFSIIIKIYYILCYCRENNIDIITICEEKLEYNYTRPEYKREVKNVVK